MSGYGNQRIDSRIVQLQATSICAAKTSDFCRIGAGPKVPSMPPFYRDSPYLSTESLPFCTSSRQ
jgi:hypothetical protein